MARVKRVENSRKPHVCGRGGHEIPKGDPYLTASPGYRGRPQYRCVKHPFRASELTTGAASEPMAAVEAFEDAAADGFDDHDALDSAWQELLSAIEDYVSTREQALDAWPNGNSALEDLYHTAQAAFDEASTFEVHEYDGDEPSRYDYGEDDEGQDLYDEAWAQWDAARRDDLAEQVDDALATAQSLEF